jgi:hypothetical protein
MRLIFILYDYVAGSMQMHGNFVIEALRRAGVNVKAMLYTDFKKPENDSIYVLVKVMQDPQKDIVKKIRSKSNSLIVYDPIDNFNWDNLKLGFHYIIANNEAHAVEIKKHTNAKTIIIPHFHTNLTRKRKEITEINTIGCIGSTIQLCGVKQIVDECILRNLKWYSAVSDNPKEVEQQTLKLDVSLIYINEEINNRGLLLKNTIAFKPTTKLINVLSYGIPCFFTPYNSYLEIVQKTPELEWFIINNIEQAFKKIDKLRSNPDLLNKMCELVFKAAEPYHLDNCHKYYRFKSTDKYII